MGCDLLIRVLEKKNYILAQGFDYENIVSDREDGLLSFRSGVDRDITRYFDYWLKKCAFIFLARSSF